MAVKISCIHKDDRNNPYEAITHVGGIRPNGTRWKITQQEAIRYIENGTYDFYVDVNNDSVRVIVAISARGNKYIKTVADGDYPNNLLALDECPI